MGFLGAHRKFLAHGKCLVTEDLEDPSERNQRLMVTVQRALSCIREGNDNPLQCSCLENPRDGGAWWAAVYGVAQSWTRLK